MYQITKNVEVALELDNGQKLEKNLMHLIEKA